MRLYVDGLRVASLADTTQGEAYLGYWRVGGDTQRLARPPEHVNFVNGYVDEVAVYPTALSPSQSSPSIRRADARRIPPPPPMLRRRGVRRLAGSLLAPRRAVRDPPPMTRPSAEQRTSRDGVVLAPTSVLAGNAAARFDAQRLRLVQCRRAQPDGVLRGHGQHGHDERRQDHRLRNSPRPAISTQLRPPRLHAERRTPRVWRLPRAQIDHDQPGGTYNDGQWRSGRHQSSSTG